MEKRCFACMNLVDGNVCRLCGHNNADPGNGKEPLLKPGTVVGGRYYVGLSVDRNGEGVTYIAYDENIQTRVRVREFFPGALCHREADHKTVAVNNGCEIQFKALMTDFVELSKQLIGITANNNLLKAKDILADNGTIYVIYEDVNGVTLTKYLMEKVGELSWEETENLFLPLLYTVKLLNSNGIIHRGISPDTIIVTENHELKLKGVCTSAVRAINTEIKSELFTGYAAPEQYEKCASHGEWTDVYAICAVLYKTLTGTMPERADIRRSGQNGHGPADTLIPPIELNPAVPYNVSDAIMRGLACERSRRTLYIKDLIGGLYAAAPSSQPARRIIEEDDDEELEVRMPSRRSAPGSRRKKKKRIHIPVWLIVIVVTLPLLLLLFFLTYYYVLGDGAASKPPATVSEVSSDTSSMASSTPSSMPSSSETDPAVPKIVVDDFVGKNYEDIITNETFSQLYTFEEKAEEYDESAPIGQVIKQSLDKSTLVEQGAKITLTVSKGRQYVTLPPLKDGNNVPISVETYQQFLTEQGLTVKIEQMDDASYPAGQIIKLSQEVGTAVNRDEVTEIIIYVSTGQSYDVLYGGGSSDLFDSED